MLSPPYTPERSACATRPRRLCMPTAPVPPVRTSRPGTRDSPQLSDGDVVLLAERLHLCLPPARIAAVGSVLGLAPAPHPAALPPRTLAAAVVAALFNGAASRPKAT